MRLFSRQAGYALLMGTSLTLLWAACSPRTGRQTAKPRGDDMVATVQADLKQLEKKSVPVDESVRMGTLPNGMTYYIQRNAKPEQRAELRLALNAGSLMEDPDQLGLAHFTEHMAFNGTANFKKSELVDYLESVGTKFGPDLNAYTSFDETVYMLQVRTDDQDIFAKGMTIMQDWASAVAFDDEEIDKERGVVISEWRTGLSPERRMSNEYLPKLFAGSRYADRLPIGEPEIIQNADYETVRRFYRDWYRPDLMAVVVVGDVDVDAVEADIKARFGSIQNPENERQREDYGVPDNAEPLVAVVTDKEASFTQVQLMYKHKTFKVNNLRDYRQQIIHSLYNRMLSARLDELAQKSDAPFIFAYSGYDEAIRTLDAYSSMASVAEGEAATGLMALLRENKRVQQHGFTATELERAKANILADVEKSYKERDKKESGGLSMRLVYNFLQGSPIPSPAQQFEVYQQFVPGIGLDEVNALAKKWITDENRVVIITGPEKEGVPMPSEADVKRILAEADQMSVEAYVDNVSDKPLLDVRQLGMADIRSEEQIEAIGSTVITLANGVRVVLKPTDFKNDEILMTAYSPGGTSLYSDAEYPSASAAATVVDESGIADFDLSTLQKMLAGKNLSVSPYINELEEGLTGNASPQDLETMLQLTYLYFTQPRRDEDALKSFVTKNKAIGANLMSNPQFYFFDQVVKLTTGNHPRRSIFPSAEQLDAMNMDDVMRIYQERFADASDFTFVFVGNFDLATMKPLLQRYLGSLPSTGRSEQWKDVGADFPKGKLEKQLVKGKEPQSQVFLAFSGPFDWDNSEARYHFNAMRDVLNIKLRESLREDKGGVYGVQVQGNTEREPKQEFAFVISFVCDPGMVDTLIEAAFAEIEKVKANGAEEKDLQKVTETQRQERIKQLKENNFWLGGLASSFQYGLDPTRLLMDNYEKAIQALDSDDIKAMANSTFNEGTNYVRIVMVPEE